ncbi:MAG: XdhC family protein [Halobacteria archaeon]|nr:XdhC family protein [Halobacteria archaeon]
MYSTDSEVLETAARWLDEGRRVALVTVAKTWGSSPRPAGALMLMATDGAFVGSVSGGCVEEDLVMRYRAGQLGDEYPTLIDYGIDRTQATRLGLPCGGRLELLVELLDSAAPLRQLLDDIRSGQLVARRVCLNTGEVSLHAVSDAADAFAYQADTLSKVFGPRWQLLLIGDGQLTRYVTQLALMLDYRVIICDPRDTAAAEPLPQGVERVGMMPDEAVQTCVNHPRSVVVALTHDPKLDDMALFEALNSQAFYVGAIGSKLNSERRRERLQALGLTATQLQRLHAPVGLPIGSHAAPEIALAIMAEVTALRNRATQVAAHHPAGT